MQLDEVTLRRVVDDWAGAALRLVMLMPAHPAVKRDLPGLCARAPHDPYRREDRNAVKNSQRGWCWSPVIAEESRMPVQCRPSMLRCRFRWRTGCNPRRSMSLSMCEPAHRAAALKQPLSEPHGNVTRAGSSEAVLVARQRTLDESTGRRWGAAEQARRGAGSASGLLNARLLLVPAVMFSYLMVRIARKSALWKTVTRIHRSALRRQTVLPI